jgi:phosphatidylserine/phosphatidylglycerophosphate/cardiolipin synthase-like enzyme
VPVPKQDHVTSLRSLIGGREDSLARFGAALWAQVGRQLVAKDLDWARSIGREDAPHIVWAALSQSGAVSGEPPILRAAPLCRLLLSIAAPDTASDTEAQEPSPRLVWTLPEAVALAIPGRRGTYLEAFVCLVDACREKLLIVSPYVDSRGVGFLFTPLLNALGRGVQVTVVTHDMLNATSPNATAVEELRREAWRVRGKLAVYSADAGAGADRREHPLLHAKLVVADQIRLLLGSANLTSHAMASNLEVGTILGPVAAGEATTILGALIHSGMVQLVFTTSEQGPAP